MCCASSRPPARLNRGCQRSAVAIEARCVAASPLASRREVLGALIWSHDEDRRRAGAGIYHRQDTYSIGGCSLLQSVSPSPREEAVAEGGPPPRASQRWCVGPRQGRSPDCLFGRPIQQKGSSGKPEATVPHTHPRSTFNQGRSVKSVDRRSPSRPTYDSRIAYASPRRDDLGGIDRPSAFLPAR